MRLLGILTATFVVCTIGVGLGGWSAWRALALDLFIERTEVDGWTAYTKLANPQNNPYASAKAAQLGGLPLGRAEGFAFTATTDSSGELLRSGCNYALSGSLPAARLWTLDAVGPDARSLLADDAPQRVMNSRAIVRPSSEVSSTASSQTPVSISVGPDPKPGNWMRTAGDRPLTLLLRLYDTQVGTGVSVRDISLPTISHARSGNGC